jgi:sensor histidine kinase YesM
VQPLVENAVRHGVGPMEDGGTIRLCVRRHEDRIRVIVEDDGVGPDEKEGPITNGQSFESARATASPEAAKGGVGLKNTDERLRRVLGEGSGLHTEAVDPHGFRVWFDVPDALKGADR